jgi:anti-sigma factor RsiW
VKECSCHELLGAMGLYLDGEAASDVCAQIESHLASCPDCRLEVETMRKTMRIVHATPKDSLSDEARERLFHALHLEKYLPPSKIERS